MNIPTINLARTGANIVMLRKAAGLTVHDLQMAFGFNSPQAIYKWQNGTLMYLHHIEEKREICNK